MVNIKINFSNKTIYLLASIFVLIATIGVVYATMGSIPNPGHALSELQNCTNGETLVMSGGEWTCGSAGNFLEECKWVIVGDECSLDFGKTITGDGLNQEYSGCEDGGRVEGTLDMDESPYIICPDDYPFMKGFSIMDQDGSAGVDVGDFVAYCCK